MVFKYAWVMHEFEVCMARRAPISSKAGITQLKPEEKEYKVAVQGTNCLYVKVTPQGKKLYVTYVTVSRTLNLPKGTPRQRSYTHGPVDHFTLSAIKKAHGDIYSQLKEGITPKERQQKKIAEIERDQWLTTPIVDLGIARMQRLLDQGALTNDYNDRWSVGLIRQVIKNTSFSEFNSSHADQLAKAYPPTSAWSKADKVKKQIGKLYRDLPSDARQTLGRDIPHLLERSFGRIKQKKRNDEVIALSDLTTLWKLMLASPVNPLMKDAWVFTLLCGERKTAVLHAKKEAIHFTTNPPLIYFDSKRDTDHEGMNLVPLTPMLGALTERVFKASPNDYLFPSQKGKHGPLTSIKPLTESIGGIGVNDVKAVSHNLRRTVANAARAVLGSTELADEHILHFKKYMSGSASHYFSPRALEFVEARSNTFHRTQIHLDDMILAGMVYGMSDDESRGSIEYLSFSIGQPWCDLRVPHHTQPSTDAILSMGLVKSPIGSFCAGSEVWVPIKNRPRLSAMLINEWANFGEQPPIDFVQSIE